MGEIMSWKQTLNHELDAMLSAAMPASLACDTPTGRLECDLASIDGIGCAFTKLALRADKLPNATVDELKQISEKLSQTINYLLEPISPIEIDSEGATVQMRSNPPQKDDDGTTYYELLVRRDGLTLCRYSRVVGQSRQEVPANVTREVLTRLAGDFVAAVA